MTRPVNNTTTTIYNGLMDAAAAAETNIKNLLDSAAGKSLSPVEMLKLQNDISKQTNVQTGVNTITSKLMQRDTEFARMSGLRG